MLDQVEAPKWSREALAARRISRSIVGVARRLRRERTATSVGGAAALVLTSLLKDGPESAARLGAAHGLSRTAQTRLLTDLEGQGFIRRSFDAADRRRQLFEITEDGTAAITTRGTRSWLEMALVQRLTSPELKLLAEAALLLDRLAAE